jgi:ribonucleoside-diphosphate reductase alpha chain
LKNILVTKRNGEKEEFDILKVKRSIAYACEGTDANPLELESRIDYFVKNGIKTQEIQANIIQHALQLATASNPEWLMVAGHAFAMDEFHSFLQKGKTFNQWAKHACSKGVWTKQVLDYYTDDDLDVLGRYIDYNRDLNHSYASLLTAKQKYLGKNEVNQIMHMGNAMRFGQAEPVETRMEFVKSVYDILSNRKFSLATPFMLNLRHGGNTASCFIVSVEDDLSSIFDNVKRVAEISKNGGGIGIFLGYLRAKGSVVNGNENAAGSIVQWVKIFNDTLVAVNQGGKRAGAGTVALPIWHNDLFDFLNMQTEHGDIRMKAYDVFPQITVPDVFMERDKNQQQWVLFCPFEVKQKLGIDVRGLYGEDFTKAYLQIEQAAQSGKLKVSSIIPNARDIMKQIMRIQFETGLPYLAFTDRMNEANPNKGDKEAYGIPCANLCTESYSNVKPDVYGHVCNLGSINMGNIKDFDDLAYVSRMACRILNRGVDLTKNPNEITEAHNKRYRTIGIGVMGIHDYLAREYKTFDDLETISDMFEVIEYNAALESVDLAKKHGTFEAYDVSEWKNGNMTKRFASHGGKCDWGYLQQQIDEHGIFNSQLTSPAPTTSTSIYQDASASVQPVFKAFFAEDNKNGLLKVGSRFLKENPIGYMKTQSQFDAKEIIDAVAEMQKWVDTGISMELMFDQNKQGFNAKDLYDAIHYAFDKRLKTIYYIRSVKEREDDCVACSG